MCGSVHLYYLNGFHGMGLPFGSQHRTYCCFFKAFECI